MRVSPGHGPVEQLAATFGGLPSAVACPNAPHSDEKSL